MISYNITQILGQLFSKTCKKLLRSKERGRVKFPGFLIVLEMAGKKVAAKKAGKVAFHVFEAGGGKRPIGLFLQAERAKTRSLRDRKFVGVDTKRVDVNRLLKKLRIEKKPENLLLRQQCAVDAVEALEPNSQHVIFSSYLLNCLIYEPARPEHDFMQLDWVFAKFAKRALRPGGRLALVQNRTDVPYFKGMAESLGMAFHAIEIPDAKASKSPAWEIRSKSTPAKRLTILKKYLETVGLSGSRAQDYVQEKLRYAGLKREEDYEKPTIMLFRKRRKGEKAAVAITAGGVSQGLTKLSPEERRIVEEILSRQM